ncbi:MAG: hypothetical protein IJ635_06520 [Bacteroidaceae bacterium]|nr:hypothetical protein [Bacteroidaceae bacterium]
MEMTFKSAFVAFLATVFSLNLSAQSVPVAVLQHGDDVKTFTGTTAFKEAMDAAESGDLISLSAGVFQFVDITKAVKIQGVGYVQDEENGRYRTTLDLLYKGGDNSFINIPENEEGLYVEGVYFSSNTNRNVRAQGVLNQFVFKNCYFGSLRFGYGMGRFESEMGLIENCKIGRLMTGNVKNLSINNSVINFFTISDDDTPSINHCVITDQITSYGAGLFQNSLLHKLAPKSTDQYYNNVILHVSNSTDLITPNIQGNIIYTTGQEDEYCSYFQDPTHGNTFDVSYDYKLTDEAASMYISNDGTQVGIYGGEKPFTDVPSNPQITAKQIATQSDADGKLSVKITVEAQK